MQKQEEWKNKQEVSTEKAISRKKAVVTLFCHKCETTKDFIVTYGLIDFINGKCKFIGFHSTCEKCGAKSGMRLSW